MTKNRRYSNPASRLHPNRPAGCNHWPVGQAACDGRAVQAADRPSHAMGFPISDPVLDTSRNQVNYAH